MLLLASANPPLYDAILQEDRIVEWLTAMLFIAAGILRIGHAIKTRSWFDLLIGAFCIFVGGEEFSWGQRLLGFTPPDVFLEHNTQQEFTLHNFADIFGKPKGILILALLGYALVTPLLARFTRLGATPPKRSVALWLVVAAALLLWYPVDLTGEWVEALAGFCFLVATPAPVVSRAITGAMAAVAALGLTALSTRLGSGGPAALSCAQSEARAILADVVSGLHDYPDLLEHNVHKRIYTAIDDGYVGAGQAQYHAVQCGRESREHADRRRRFVVDPWGMAYWVRSRRAGAGVRITVYSFGPNRARDARDVKAEILVDSERGR